LFFWRIRVPAWILGGSLEAEGFGDGQTSCEGCPIAKLRLTLPPILPNPQLLCQIIKKPLRISPKWLIKKNLPMLL